MHGNLNFEIIFDGGDETNQAGFSMNEKNQENGILSLQTPAINPADVRVNLGTETSKPDRYGKSSQLVPIKVNKKIFDFRVSLFSEHFGLDLHTLLFPNSLTFWNKAWNTVLTNTLFYDKAFKVLPTDECRTYKDIKRRDDEARNFSKEDITSTEHCVKGHAVFYPANFLCDDDKILKMSFVQNLVLPIRALL